MKRTISMKAAAALAATAVLAVCGSVYADEDEKTEEAAEAVAPRKTERVFSALIRCARAADGTAVCRPGGDWAPAEEGRYYPLGSAFRAPAGGEGVFEFGEKTSFTVTGGAEVASEAGEIGAATRGLILRRGKVSVNVPRTLTEGLFTVKAPFFVCSNLAGESVYDYAAPGDGDEAVVRCVTGSLALEGAHYKVAKMGAANQVRIRTTGDNLFTSLRGESGDIKAVLDQGLVPQKNFETGEVADVPRTLDYTLSPQCAIKIWRKRPAVSERWAVSVMTFDAAGEMKNRCAFMEGRSSLNSGELVIPPKTAEDAEKETAKKAAEDSEAVETVEAAPAKDDDEEKKDEEKKDEASDL